MADAFKQLFSSSPSCSVFVNVVLCAERMLCRLIQYGIRNTGSTASLDHSACHDHSSVVEEFRHDIHRQTHNSGVTTDNHGVSKGLEIIPAKNVEVILAVLPYTSWTTRIRPTMDTATGSSL